jgi:hypothetical protein
MLDKQQVGVYNSPNYHKERGDACRLRSIEEIKSNESYPVTVISQGRKELSNE